LDYNESLSIAKEKKNKLSVILIVVKQCGSVSVDTLRDGCNALREAVNDELKSLHIGDVAEVKFIDACEFNNIRRKDIPKNRTFATYKKKTGEYFGTYVDMTYGEAFIVFIIGETNGKVDILSVPEKNIQKVTILSPKRPVKIISDAGDPMLVGGYHSKYQTKRGGLGEQTNRQEETEW